jgi:hypothetical protein
MRWPDIIAPRRQLRSEGAPAAPRWTGSAIDIINEAGIMKHCAQQAATSATPTPASDRGLRPRRAAPRARAEAVAVITVALLAPVAVSGEVPWRPLAAGLEIAEVTLSRPEAATATVVRAAADRWELVLVGLGTSGTAPTRTARQWAAESDLAVATNAGMFAADHRTHLGYLESRGEVRSSRVNDYQSVAAFDPRDPVRTAPFRIFDLDAPGVSIEAIRRNYASLLQNLRLIRSPGENRWSDQGRRWSEAALGEDAEGRVLLIHCRVAFSMHELNRRLLASGIGLAAAQHLEGGPEAQLYVRVGDTELERVGSYETGFREDDGNAFAWPVPHVLGLRPRPMP